MFASFLKSSLLVLATLAISIATSTAQTAIPGGNVSGVWEASGSPYLVEGEITVPSGDSLIIEPGVDIIFQGHHMFKVNGTLEALGTEADSIVFTATDPDTGWWGLRFYYNASNSQLLRCIVEYARGYGEYPAVEAGGIYITGCDPVISLCTIRNNTGEIGGGICCWDDANPTINGCVIESNVSTSNGGGIWIHSSAPHISNCLVIGNTAVYGGGIATHYGGWGPRIERCIVTDNHSENGAVYFGLWNQYETVVKMKDCIVAFNNGIGGVNYYYESSGDMMYCCIFGNEGGNLIGEVPEGIGTLSTTNVNGDSCDAFANIYEDPQFVEPVNGDYHLQSIIGSYHGGAWTPDPVHSPCIDAGHPLSDVSFEPIPNRGRVNIGLYGGTNEASLSTSDVLQGTSPVFGGTWTLSESPYIIFGQIYLPENYDLTIEPGVEVRFDENSGMTVHSDLSANGTADSITFTSNLPDPQMGDWSGIIFAGDISCDMDYCKVEYGVIGATAPYPFGAEMNLFRCSLSGISGTVKTAVINECNINGGVSGYPGNYGHGSMTIDNCEVYGYISCSSYDSELNITNNIIYGNLNTAVGYVGETYNINNNTLNNGCISFSHSTETAGTLGGNTVNNAPGNGISINLYWGPISGGTGTSGNTINGAVGDGIQITTGADPSSSVSSGSNNIFNVGGRGIYVRREYLGGWSYNAFVTGNTIETCGQGAVVVENFNNISITNNSIIGSGLEAIKISNPYNGYNGVDINVEQNTIYGSIQGIIINQPNSTEEQTTITIDSNTIIDIDSVGISVGNVEEDSLNLFITHNVITVGEPYSIVVANAQLIEIISNSLFGGGVKITYPILDDRYNLILNNIISSGNDYGVLLSGVDSTVVSYNNVWNFGSGNYSGVTPGPGSISVDPLFVDPDSGDFHLQSVTASYHNGAWFPDPQHSPCIDAGDPTYPFENEPEPNGDRINMGAYGNTSEASLSIVPQPEIALSDTFLDFGPIQIGEPDSLPLIVYNTGYADLILYDLSNSYPTFTTNFDQADSLIAPQDSLLIMVTFSPENITVYHDTLTILNNDSTVCVSLQGRGGNGPVIVTLTPYNTPIVIPPGGDSFDFNIAAENTASFTVNFEIWTLATLPNGTQYGPLLGPVNLTLAGGASINRDRTQTVPAGAPVGNYLYNAYTGFYPFEIWWTDNFLFTKSGTGDGDGLQGWFCEGELFPEEGLNARSLPEEFALSGAYPNPFNPVTNFDMGLPEAAKVHFAVYDISGRLVATLMDGWRDAGYHRVTFNRSDLASGVYLYRLKAGTFTARGKMVMVK